MSLRTAFPRRVPFMNPITLRNRVVSPSAFQRFNSSAATSRRTSADMLELAASNRPAALEASVPLLWMLSGTVIYQAWSRIDPASEQANACVEQVASYRLNLHKSIRATVWFLGVLSGAYGLCSGLKDGLKNISCMHRTGWGLGEQSVIVT
ncbi:hypothetical protein AOQ84DRAFT_71199 [Glonium stellatum]|uniref:Uncharacterized protein n=1 Tax=Glonium stellatum TaxID=574774 RepID=A0A8E2EY47_9PEZI|nr:hypothetical protein AOQ84DRAFT_71199 [Glonium stellatum]